MTLSVAALIRSNVCELERRAKTISPNAWAMLGCFPECWRLTVRLGPGVLKSFEGDDPAPLFAKANALIREHDPEAVAMALGLEIPSPIHP